MRFIQIISLVLLTTVSQITLSQSPTNESKIDIKQATEVKPASPKNKKLLTYQETAVICAEVFGSLKDRISESTESKLFSTDSELSVVWPSEQGREPIYCGVDRKTREIVSFINNGKYVDQSELSQLITNSKLTKEALNGKYNNFVAIQKMKLANKFKDPDSVKYRSLFVSISSFPTLCGEVNAKNSYGAYVGFRRFYAMGIDLITRVEDTENGMPFGEMWRSACGGKTTNVK